MGAYVYLLPEGSYAAPKVAIFEILKYIKMEK